MSTAEQRWFHRDGALAEGDWRSVVDSRIPGWEHTGLRVADVAAGQVLTLTETGVERLFVPLTGSFVVDWVEDGVRTTTELAGRASVFHGPTDVLYLSCRATAELRGAGRIAVATSPTSAHRASRHVLREAAPAELRGAGRSSREVRNFGTPETLDAARLIVCEVITPAGNWSSYPPHKHDEDIPGHESELEEIYYFESESVPAAASGTAPGFGMFRVSSSSVGDIDLTLDVASGDVVLVPYGYHGPAAAAPGYDLYYLNVMAGPSEERAWLISDDPAHAWVRESWAHELVDARLPMSRTEGTTP